MAPKNFRLFVSAVSLSAVWDFWFMHSLYGLDPMPNALGQVQSVGYKGFQYLPVRGWGARSLQNISPEECTVRSFEDVWTPGLKGDFVEVVHRTFKIGKFWDKCPTWSDWGLFGNKAQFSHLLELVPKFVPKVVHTTKEYEALISEGRPALLEVTQHFTMARTPAAEMGFAQHSERYVWDTLHSESARADWKELFLQISGQVELVHVHPTVRQLVDFLRHGIHSDFGQRLKFVMDHTRDDCDFVLEIFPLPIPAFVMRPLLQRFLTLMNRINV